MPCVCKYPFGDERAPEDLWSICKCPDLDSFLLTGTLASSNSFKCHLVYLKTNKQTNRKFICSVALKKSLQSSEHRPLMVDYGARQRLLCGSYSHSWFIVLLFVFIPVFLDTPQSKFCQLTLLSEEIEQPKLPFFKPILLWWHFDKMASNQPWPKVPRTSWSSYCTCGVLRMAMFPFM